MLSNLVVVTCVAMVVLVMVIGKHGVCAPVCSGERDEKEGMK